MSWLKKQTCFSNRTLVLCAVAFLAAGAVVGQLVARGGSGGATTPRGAATVEVYRPAGPGRPEIAETLRVAEEGPPAGGEDRPVWVVRFASDRGTIVYRGYSVSSRD